MRLVKDHSPGAYAVSVRCLGCGKMMRLCDSLIDTEGPEFQAYYHKGCVPEGEHSIEPSCNRDGCPRCEQKQA